MPEDSREFGLEPEVAGAVRYLRARGRFVLAACGVAVATALAVSLLLPKKYTAVCRILIEAPGGSDIRAATAVSPVYLESLRTYELFASSDDLFLRAAERFALRGGSTPIDALKKSVLKVQIPRNTRVLEIYATLPDARKAHQMALFLGQQTVELSRSTAQAGGSERIGAAARDADDARARFEKAEQAWADAAARGPVDPLASELDADLALRSRLLRRYFSSGDPGDPQGSVLRREAAALDSKIASEQKTLGERTARLAVLDSARRSAEAEYQAAGQRAREARSAAGLGSERLSVIDPGVVPERPSSPKVLLNVVVAGAAALVLALLWLLLRYGWGQPPPAPDRYAARVAVRHD